MMRVLELMNPSLKNVYKRDPFDILMTLLKGVHEELNHAEKREGTGSALSSDPSFENTKFIELDYIQAEKWIRYFRE